MVLSERIQVYLVLIHLATPLMYIPRSLAFWNHLVIYVPVGFLVVVGMNCRDAIRVTIIGAAAESAIDFSGPCAASLCLPGFRSFFSSPSLLPPLSLRRSPFRKTSSFLSLVLEIQSTNKHPSTPTVRSQCSTTSKEEERILT